MIKTNWNNTNNHKSDIRFMRAMAAPRPHPHGRIATETHLPTNFQSSPARTHHSIAITLTFEYTPTQNLMYYYNQEEKVSQLLEFLQRKIGSQYIYFKSGNIHIDYFLTLLDRPLIQLKAKRLKLEGYKISINDSSHLQQIQFIKCIGSGGFSKVLLGRIYGQLMAIKLVDKQFILAQGKQTIIQNERSILEACSGHPFITKLHLAFETSKYVAFIMEYCNGGELFNLLRKVKKMKEADARFYFLETLSALEHLHSKGILYRDLKPENIILDSDGHVRLADFGLSKIIHESRTYSFCGSAEYMSPQMLLNRGHSYEVDFYCLGALLYQLVTGLPPFYSRNQNQLFENILSAELTFPSHAQLSQPLQDLLKKMLQKQVCDRFKNFQQILAHPWVASWFDRQQLESRRLNPPFKTDNFLYNFDDSQFEGEENEILKAVENDKRSQQFQTKFMNFNFESQEIGDLKKKISQQPSLSFLKNKQTALLSRISRQNSNDNSHKSYSANNETSDRRYKNSRKGLNVSQAKQSSKDRGLKNIRSAQNLKMFYNPHKLSSKQFNIYTSKAAVSPSSPRFDQHRNSRQIWKQSHRPFRNNLSGSFSRDWSVNSDKSKGVSRQKKFGNGGKYPGLQSSLSAKGYLTLHRDRPYISKVKKAYRNSEGVNFYYQSNYR